MRNLLLQLDTAIAPSVFDRVVAYDAGADVVMSYGGVTPESVRDLVHGTMFTRGPKDLHHTAIFVGGTDVTAAERLFDAVRGTFFGPMRVSVMLDPNGANTTAVAAVRKLTQAVGSVDGQRAVITAGTGPVGLRAAGLLAAAGAEVVITSRRPAAAAPLAASVRDRFGGVVRVASTADALHAGLALEGAVVLLNAGAGGVELVRADDWIGRVGLRAAADVNAVPPAGIAGVDPRDDGATRHGVTTFGALGVGVLKMKIHRACIARLFERNDVELDAEGIADIAREVAPHRG